MTPEFVLSLLCLPDMESLKSQSRVSCLLFRGNKAAKGSL